MKQIRQTTIGLALFALLAFGGIGAAAKSGSAASQRAISGFVNRVDLNTRTVELREKESGRTVNVQIPDGMTVKTNLSMSPALAIERLLPGMYITAIVQ
jgi:hypothetical protein